MRALAVMTCCVAACASDPVVPDDDDVGNADTPTFAAPRDAPVLLNAPLNAGGTELCGVSLAWTGTRLAVAWCEQDASEAASHHFAWLTPDGVIISQHVVEGVPGKLDSRSLVVTDDGFALVSYDGLTTSITRLRADGRLRFTYRLELMGRGTLADVGEYWQMIAAEGGTLVQVELTPGGTERARRTITSTGVYYGAATWTDDRWRVAYAREGRSGSIYDRRLTTFELDMEGGVSASSEVAGGQVVDVGRAVTTFSNRNAGNGRRSDLMVASERGGVQRLVEDTTFFDVLGRASDVGEQVAIAYAEGTSGDNGVVAFLWWQPSRSEALRCTIVDAHFAPEASITSLALVAMNHDDVAVVWEDFRTTQWLVGRVSGFTPSRLRFQRVRAGLCPM